MADVRLHLHLLVLLLFIFKPTFSLPENEALLKVKESLVHNGALNSWDLKNPNPCSDKWQGVMCINGVVSSLFLQNMSLSGAADVDALSELPGLTSIALQNNYFSGRIPEFSKLKVLRDLFLSHNNFSEEIPDQFFATMIPLQKLWLDDNKFSGKIPSSIMDLPDLTDLHLEVNSFTGQIPEPKRPTSIMSLDLSDNDLEGKIPKGLTQFGLTPFAKNEELCGEPLRKQCPNSPPEPEALQRIEPASPASAPETPKPYSPGGAGKDYKLAIALAIICFLIILIAAAVIYARRKERSYFSVLEKDSHDHTSVVEVHVPGSANGSQKLTDDTIRKSNFSRKTSTKSRGGGGMSDLVMIDEDRTPFRLADLMKAAAEVLGNGGFGSAYKAAMANGLTVVVKRIREMNKMGWDTFDAEMRRFGRIKHPNVLIPLAYHFRRDEKLLVSEYMPKGSLLFLLHGDRGVSHSELNWPMRLKIIKGIASGMNAIHSEFQSYELPHGNLKSSNVLLNQNYEPLISDYGFHPLTDPNQAAQTMFAYKSPEYTQFQQVSPKSDVYCLGILLLEIITGKFPSQYLSNAKGGIDVVELVSSLVGDKDREAELIDPDISVNATGDSISMMIKLLRIGLACSETEPEKRPNMVEAVKRIQEIQE